MTPAASSRPYRPPLRGEGYRCIVPSLTPNDASTGLELLAEQLKAHIDAETKGADNPIFLVGFSMGGLVSRYYLQELEGHRKTKAFFSIAAPHHGSLMAYLSGNRGAQQMRPGSGFLQALEQSSTLLNDTPCYSYWTPFDLMILPASSSIWDQAENVKTYVLCHPLMVKNSWLINDIMAKVKLIHGVR